MNSQAICVFNFSKLFYQPYMNQKVTQVVEWNNLTTGYWTQPPLVLINWCGCQGHADVIYWWSKQLSRSRLVTCEVFSYMVPGAKRVIGLRPTGVHSLVRLPKACWWDPNDDRNRHQDQGWSCAKSTPFRTMFFVMFRNANVKSVLRLWCKKDWQTKW